MSIILKGIDIPKCSNEDCIVVIRHDKAEVWQTGYKERTVEAIQIDRPHGRLIDADKLKMECYRTMDELVESTTMIISAEALSLLCGFTMIGEAPTILEEES